MNNVYYRVVEDNFADEIDRTWMIDVVIQTTDLTDFKSFEDAIEECYDRIQERIDEEEDEDEPDEGYLDRLKEKLEDSNVADWTEYTFAISQPEVRVAGEGVNVAEVEGRRIVQDYLEAGNPLTEPDRRILNQISEQAKPGNKGPNRKLKLLKDRPRPPMDFNHVKLDPRVAGVLNQAEIKGLLAKHRSIYLDQDWKAIHSAIDSDFGSRKHEGCFFHVLTVFIGEGVCVTFVTLVQRGESAPDTHATMDLATGDFEWPATEDQGSEDEWRPEFN